MREKIVFHIRSSMTIACNFALDFISSFLISSHPEWNPRTWSNREIGKIGREFKGSVVNVSAANDSDKAGSKYNNYFPNATSYSITNYGHGEEGTSGSYDEKILDLSEKYDGSFGKFDIVLSHTVIEHIPSAEIAIENLCLLSNDVVITVVPFIQPFHGREEYSDYWRYSPMCLVKEFHKRGFFTLYINWNEDHALSNVYILHVASKFPEKYIKKFGQVTRPVASKAGPGMLFNELLWGGVSADNTMPRKIGAFLGCRLNLND